MTKRAEETRALRLQMDESQAGRSTRGTHSD